ncbi:MAG: hypothetical protein RL742_711, partial [Bacteroidota bacterium]
TPIIAANEFLHDELQWRMLDERVRD